MKAFYIIGLMAVAGCTVDAASCDPNRVANVLTSASCSQQGMFEQRRQNLQSNSNTIFAEIERERMAISSANNRIRTLQAEQRLTADQSQQLNRQITALNQDVNRMAAADPVQAAALRGQIAQRKAAINSYAGVAVF